MQVFVLRLQNRAADDGVEGTVGQQGCATARMVGDGATRFLWKVGMGIVQLHVRWEEVGGDVDAGGRWGNGKVHTGTIVESFGMTGQQEV
eukprot:12706559-Prorocentrum_lima.AAC.1